MNVSELCIRRPVMTTLAMLAILLFGAIAYRALPIAELPNVDFPTIEVTTRLPGANAETMGSAVATPLENVFSRIAGVKAMTSVSTQGSTRVTLEFDLDRDIDAAALDVQSAISSALRSLPEDLPEPPSFRKINPSDFAILFVQMSSKTVPISTLTDYAETVLQQRVSTIPGVAQVQFWGSQKYALRIQVRPDALVARGIGFDEVERAVRAANTNLPTGSLSGSAKETAIRTTGALAGAPAFNDLVVAYRNGAPVRVRDIGRAIDGVEEEKSGTWFGEEQGMVMALYRQPGSNTVQIVDQVRDILPTLRAQLPAGITLDVLYDRSQGIRESIHDVEFTLVLAAGLVVMVIFLFLRNLTATFIAGIALPISIIGTFAAMWVLGFSLNNLSLMALTLAVGFVVDDAIVMLENIVRRKEQGLSTLQAAIEGSREIGFTILSMTISLVAVFLPIIFMGGMLGRLLNEFAITISVAIIISGVVSLTLTPMLCSRMLREGGHGGHGGGHAPASSEGRRPSLFHRVLEAPFDGMLWFYRVTLDFCLRNHLLVMLSFIATIWLTVHLYGTIQKDFLPEEDTGRLLVRTEAGQDASYDALIGYQRQMARLAAADPNIAQVMERAGGGGGATNANQGFLLLILKPRAERPVKEIAPIVQGLRRKLNEVPGIRAFVLNPPPIRVGGRLSNADYQYTLQDLDLETLNTWSQRLADRLRVTPGFQDVSSDLKITKPSVLVRIDRDRAAALGVDPREIEAVLAAAFGSRKVSTILTSASQYAVVLEIDPAYQRSAASLSQIYVKARNGRLVPLDSVTTQAREVSPLSISHQGQLPAVTLSFNLAPEITIGTAIERVREIEREMQMPATMITSFGGTAKAFEESLAGMGILLVMAILVVYIVLGMLYESFIHPITILTGLPAAGLGALLALQWYGLPLTLYAFVGILLLVGIVKKNAIMMIDFALAAQREQGLAPADAIRQACLVRFRPIMMTTFAALVGAIPIAIGHGPGAEARAPLGIAVVGGLAVSQVITLYLTPVVYLYLDALQRLLGGGTKAPSQPATATGAGDKLQAAE